MGQIGQAASNPNTFAPDPSGLNGSEWATRLAGAGAKGLGGALQNQPQRPQGGPMPIQQAPPPNVQMQQPVNFTGNQDVGFKQRRDPFFGQ